MKQVSEAELKRFFDETGLWKHHEDFFNQQMFDTSEEHKKKFMGDHRENYIEYIAVRFNGDVDAAIKDGKKLRKIFENMDRSELEPISFKVQEFFKNILK